MVGRLVWTRGIRSHGFLAASSARQQYILLHQSEVNIVLQGHYWLCMTKGDTTSRWASVMSTDAPGLAALKGASGKTCL